VTTKEFKFDLAQKKMLKAAPSTKGNIKVLPPINLDEEVTNVTTLPLLHSMVNLNPIQDKTEEIKFNPKLLAIRSPESRHSKW
jgi:hypothetical protein